MIKVDVGFRSSGSFLIIFVQHLDPPYPAVLLTVI